MGSAPGDHGRPRRRISTVLTRQGLPTSAVGSNRDQSPHWSNASRATACRMQMGDSMRSLARQGSIEHPATGVLDLRLTGPTHPLTIDGRERIERAETEPVEDVATEAAPPIPFIVKELLAAGGMAKVYRVEDADGVPLAVKILRSELATHLDEVARFLAEHEVACRIEHPSIGRVHTAQMIDGVPYLVMELIEGEPLARIAERVQLAPGAVAGIGAQIADALACAHSARILHCDVKPDNVLVLREPGLAGWPRAKLIDFGVARFLGEPGPGEDVVSGTPAYMAPEQWHGEATPLSDIYALGCVLYELVGGRPPFVGSYSEIMVAHLEQRPIHPARLRPGLPPALEDLILAMLAKAPRARPASMAAIAAHLTELALLMPPSGRLITASDAANDCDDDDWATS
jgi:serine/threonine protein kinase